MSRKSFFRNLSGMSAVTYGILIGFILAVALPSVAIVGSRVKDGYRQVAAGISGADSAPGNDPGGEVPDPEAPRQGPIIVSPSILPAGVAGMFYITTFSATPDDDAAIASWSIPSAQIPSGLSLSAATGELSGIPVGGDYVFSAMVTDSRGASSKKDFWLAIEPHLAPVIATETSLPVGTAGRAYSVTFEGTASNGASITSWIS